MTKFCLLASCCVALVALIGCGNKAAPLSPREATIQGFKSSGTPPCTEAFAVDGSAISEAAQIACYSDDAEGLVLRTSNRKMCVDGTSVGWNQFGWWDTTGKIHLYPTGDVSHVAPKNVRETCQGGPRTP